MAMQRKVICCNIHPMENIPIPASSRKMTPLGLQIGVSLIEVLIVVVIIGIVAAFALPAFGDLSRNQCLISRSTDLIIALQFARSEAVKRRQPVTIRAVNIAATGTPIIAWSNGWEVGAVTGTGTVTSTSPIDLIRRFELLGCPQTTMNETTEGTEDTRDNDLVYIYWPTGFINNTGTIDICDDRTAERGRRVSINITGRPSIATLDPTDSTYSNRCP